MLNEIHNTSRAAAILYDRLRFHNKLPETTGRLGATSYQSIKLPEDYYFRTEYGVNLYRVLSIFHNSSREPRTIWYELSEPWSAMNRSTQRIYSSTMLRIIYFRRKEWNR